MLRCWFEKRDEDLSHLFEGLSIWQAGEAYRAHFQRYPVIHLSSRAPRPRASPTAGPSARRSSTSTRAPLPARAGGSTLAAHRALPSDPRRHRLPLSTSGRSSISRLPARPPRREGGHPHRRIRRAHPRGPRPRLRAGDPRLHACLSGRGPQEQPPPLQGRDDWHPPGGQGEPLLRAQQPGVYTLLAPASTPASASPRPRWGAARAVRAGDKLEEVRTWYNGYLFGGEVIYNPWSVLCFLDSRGRERPQSPTGSRRARTTW
jgi:hypothetical protein